ncbi:helix-turn-helix domain-containing protein [Desulfobacter vibrioformis]|uniref:helix-turn-helix domain-containing protein n=1 Tax=Desulfobacter vibrioformis TaxID=34031 RepID=UPI000555DCA4|nr:helix-turn-helix domain-containing protein [Desulfobacter vibrioformis]
MTSYRKLAAVEKTIAILKFMAQEVQPVSATEIANAVGEPFGTVMCHLATLEEGGLVRKVYERYELGIYWGVIWESIKQSRMSMRNLANNDLEKIGAV